MQAAFSFASPPRPPPLPLEEIVAGTGHRPDDRYPKRGVGTWKHLRLHAEVGRWLREQFVILKPVQVISGMAVGVDTWLAQAALELGIPLVAAIPFIGQEDIWPEPSRRLYRDMLARATRVVNVSGHDERAARARRQPSPPFEISHFMHARNTWMVERARTILAVWDGSEDGGTFHCVGEAQRLDRVLVRLNPHELHGFW